MSKNTKNYQLYTFTSDNDVADLKLLEQSFDVIDKGLVLDVGESSGNGNNYVLNLDSITLTSANKGISFKFWADKDSNGVVTINGTYKLVKANGNPIKNLKAGAPYTITYDGNKNFFLYSGGGDESDSTTVGTDGSKVLEPHTFIGSDGEVHTGTMPNKGAVTATLNCGGSYTIPAGYHNGSGKVTANSLASQTSANAGAGDILSGKTAWVNGSKITGTMPNRGEYQIAGGIGFGDDYVAFNKIPYGCYPQSSNGWAPEIRAKKTDVAAALGLTADKIISGSTICGIAGTIANQGAITAGNSIIQSGDKLYCRIPKGAYLTNASSGYPEISYPQGNVANALGITADKIVAGNTIGGIAGTATVGTMAKYVEADQSTVNVYTNADGTEEFKITTRFKPRFAMVNYFHSQYNKTILVLFNYTENKWYGIGRKYNNSSITTYDTSHVISVVSFENDGVIVKANPYYRSKVSWIISQ